MARATSVTPSRHETPTREIRRTVGSEVTVQEYTHARHTEYAPHQRLHSTLESAKHGISTLEVRVTGTSDRRDRGTPVTGAGCRHGRPSRASTGPSTRYGRTRNPCQR